MGLVGLPIDPRRRCVIRDKLEEGCVASIRHILCPSDRPILEVAHTVETEGFPTAKIDVVTHSRSNAG